MDKWLPDQLETIKKLCDISLALIHAETYDLLATPLEYLYEEAQRIIDENCIVEEAKTINEDGNMP